MYPGRVSTICSLNLGRGWCGAAHIMPTSQLVRVETLDVARPTLLPTSRTASRSSFARRRAFQEETQSCVERPERHNQRARNCDAPWLARCLRGGYSVRLWERDHEPTAEERVL